MRFLLFFTLSTIAIHSTAGRCRRPRVNPVMGALQNILSPANAEKTMQMLQMATQNTITNAIGPCGNPILNPTPLPVQYSPPILPIPEPCNLPINPQFITSNPKTLILPNPVQSQIPVQIPPIPLQITGPMPSQLPTPIQVANQIARPNPPVQLPTQLPLQLPVQIPNPLSIQMPNPIPLPLPIPPCQIPQLPILQPMPEIIIERPPCACQRDIVYPSTECSICNTMPPIPDVNIPIALTSAQDIYSCPIPSPAALFTMPAASPGSSWTQENMPTSCACTRSQYLRKIPIPPPTL